MDIKRKTYKYMNKHIYTPKRLSPQKILAIRHKKTVKEKLVRFVGITSLVLILAGTFMMTLALASERQVVKDCQIEKEMLADYPLKQLDELLIKHCVERDLW